LSRDAVVVARAAGKPFCAQRRRNGLDQTTRLAPRGDRVAGITRTSDPVGRNLFRARPLGDFTTRPYGRAPLRRRIDHPRRWFLRIDDPRARVAAFALIATVAIHLSPFALIALIAALLGPLIGARDRALAGQPLLRSCCFRAAVGYEPASLNSQTVNRCALARRRLPQALCSSRRWPPLRRGRHSIAVDFGALRLLVRARALLE